MTNRDLLIEVIRDLRVIIKKNPSDLKKEIQDQIKIYEYDLFTMKAKNQDEK